jgi:hypothetical protein
MPELNQTEDIMHVVEGYLEMLQRDLSNARSDGDMILAAELEAVIAQLNNAAEDREEINSGVEQYLLQGGEEGMLNQVIYLVGQTFIVERRHYLSEVVNANVQTLLSLDASDQAFIDQEAGLAISTFGVVSLVTGMMYLFSEVI